MAHDVGGHPDGQSCLWTEVCTDLWITRPAVVKVIGAPTRSKPCPQGPPSKRGVTSGRCRSRRGVTWPEVVLVEVGVHVGCRERKTPPAESAGSAAHGLRRDAAGRRWRSRAAAIVEGRPMHPVFALRTSVQRVASRNHASSEASRARPHSGGDQGGTEPVSDQDARQQRSARDSSEARLLGRRRWVADPGEAPLVASGAGS